MAEPHAHNSWILDLRGLVPPLRWAEVFSVPVEAVEVELGSGKGMFLRRESAARPGVGFLGVERAGKFFELCAGRLARDGRPNVRLTRADAFDLLARWIPEAGVCALHVYFPDPWPKKRHAKRRMLSPPLFDLGARAIATGGFLSIATDVDPYFREATDFLDAHPCFARTDLPEGTAESVATNYAVKYAREGRCLHLARYRRNATPAPPAPNPLRLRFLVDRSRAPS
jgi:tRNA (guanine-N7-)-methyltransferase